MTRQTFPVIGVTMGDPAGIGPEIVLAAVRDPEVRRACRPVVIAQIEILQQCMERLSQLKAPLRQLARPLTPAVEPSDRLAPVEVVSIEDQVAAPEKIVPGTSSAAAGRMAAACVSLACALGRSGEIDAMATAPIDKASLRLADVAHIGHTEMLAAELGVCDPLTLFLTGNLRIFFLSRHLSLRQAIDHVTRERLAVFLQRVHTALLQLGFQRPRIGVAALNPHASDGGQFGDEESVHIEPAISDARASGINAMGPIGADSIFHMALQGHFDAVVSLYHDQGHIAAKTRDFFGTITATLGLPFLRTSVDHGTALDIAWQGKAESRSMAKAILAAAQMVRKKGEMPP